MKKEILRLFASFMAIALFVGGFFPVAVFSYDGGSPSFLRETTNDLDGSDESLQMDASITDISEGNDLGLATHVSLLGESQGIFIIDSIDQLYKNIGSNRTLIIKNGIYQISTSIEIADYDTDSNWNTTWRDITNLQILAENNGKVEILSDDPYSPVLFLSHCNNIDIRGIIFGHDPAGDTACSDGGTVIEIDESHDIGIEKCDLFGCGWIGISVSDTQNVSVNDSIIRDCTYNAISYSADNNSVNVKFTNCIISGNTNKDYDLGNYDVPLISGYCNDSVDASININDCTIINNKSDILITEGSAKKVKFNDSCRYYNNAFRGELTDTYGICVNGTTWQIKGGTLYLGFDIDLGKGNIIYNSGWEVLDYSDSSLPWKGLDYSSIENYNKEKHEYSGEFQFSLSNDDNRVETTSYPFSVDLYDFFESSYEHNYELTRMSMCVAMAAMDPDRYTGTEKRATYIKDLMKKLDFQFTEDDIQYVNPNGNTIGTAIASRQVKKGNEDFTLVMVGVRGGGYLSEWAGNVNVGNKPERTVPDNHNGFDIAANTVIDRIKKHLKSSNDISDLSNVKIWICGYSRAGAVSNLTAAKLDNGEIEELEGINSNNVFAFCFECPKNTLSPKWDDNKYSNIINVVNLVDLVPLVAPDNRSNWTYHRFGTTYYINDGYSRESGFSDNYKKMKDTYARILGSYYTSERLNAQLFCYENGVKYKRINWLNRDFLCNITEIIDSPNTFMDCYQDVVYEKVYEMFGGSNPSDIGITSWISTILGVVCSGRAGARALGLFPGISKYVKINHYPELTLAWVETLQKNEYLLHSEIKNTKTAVFNCPVDIVVVDNNGNTVGRIINDEVKHIEGGVDAFIDSNGQKIVLLPSESGYKIEATAYDDGDVSITNYYYSGDEVSPKKMECYMQIGIKKNKTITTVYDEDRTTIRNSEGVILNPDLIQDAESITSAKVLVNSEGPGDVEGGGIYHIGEFCQLKAVPNEGKYFTGWSIEGDKVSTEETYRFPVIDDTTIVAYFSDVNPENQNKDTVSSDFITRELGGTGYKVRYTASVSFNGVKHIQKGRKASKAKADDMEVTLYDPDGNEVELSSYKTVFKNNKNTNSVKEPYFIIKLKYADPVTKKAVKSEKIGFNIIPCDIASLELSGTIDVDEDGWYSVPKLFYDSVTGKRIKMKPMKDNGKGDYYLNSVLEGGESVSINGINNYCGTTVLRR